MKPPCTSAVESLKAYHPPLEGRDDFLRLDFNEWLGDPHPQLSSALKTFDVSKLNMYPETSLALQAVSKHFQVSESQVLLANGTDEAFCNIYRAFVSSGEKVLLPDPGYAMMEFYSTLCEAVIEPWFLQASGFTYAVDQLENFLLRGGRCVTIAQPNNPTGSLMDPELIVSLSQKWPDRLFVVDEAYIDFGGQSLVNRAGQLANILVLRTFSKAWGLAGMRLGVVVGSQELISILKKMWSPYSVNILGLHLLTKICPDRQWIMNVQKEVQAQRKFLKKELDQRGLTTHFGEGNFFLLKVPNDIDSFISQFELRKIRLRDQSAKQDLEGWVRVSIGPEKVSKQFLKALDEVLLCTR